MMYLTLALRHLFVRPGRALVLLGGYAVGVAVMIVLLSVGDAMLDQARDVSLVGGGELTALPQGVDIEALRTGGLAGMFFGINGARFVTRELIGGQRHADLVASVSPAIEQKLVQVYAHGATYPVRAGGELPEQARAAGAGLRVVSGSWTNSDADLRWARPPAQDLYDEIDRFHTPSPGDSAWAEWHYFNVVVSDHEWWYITLMIGGDIAHGHWGGQVLVTHRTPDGAYRRYATRVSRDNVHYDTTRADISVGPGRVIQRDGVYQLRGSSGAARFDLTVLPFPRRYFPPAELGTDAAPSGYVVPALAATASGVVCDRGHCTQLRDRPAYHDHNWGSWRAVTWEWGAGQGAHHDFLYGGVIDEARRTATIPFVLALEDSLGIQQVYRFDRAELFGNRAATGMGHAPDSIRITALREADTLHLIIHVTDAAGSRSAAVGRDRIFVQMRARWRLNGTAAGAVIADTGEGFFETWVRPRP